MSFFILQADVGEALGWMSRQSALLKYFHEELERPNPVADLEKKLQATKVAAKKKIQALIKERDILKASQSELRAEIATATSSFDSLKLESAKLSEEKKEIQVAFSKAQKEVTSLRGENELLSQIKDQLTTDKASLETENDQLKATINAQSCLIANGGYMAFASCLK
jgi:chromosome segregation ATPase